MLPLILIISKYCSFVKYDFVKKNLKKKAFNSIFSIIGKNDNQYNLNIYNVSYIILKNLYALIIKKITK